MRNNRTIHIAISGAGIAGLCVAIALRKLGCNVVIFEAAPEIKPLGAGLVLAANAIKGLQRIGIADKVIPAGQALTRFSILTNEGRTLSQGDSEALNRRFGLSNFVIHRGDLHRILLEELNDVTLQTGKKATGVEQNTEGVTLHFQDNTRYKADYLIVADGVHSAIRQQLLPGSSPRYAGYTCWRAVVENPGIALSHATETWGPAGRMGIVPLRNQQIYWYLCVNAPQNSVEMKALKVADLYQSLCNYHAPIPQILEASSDDQLLWNDIVDVKPIRQYAFNRILLTGDAAHATTPNMGQGACQAIEDAAVLMDVWEKQAGESPEAMFRTVEKRRLPRATMIVERSWQLGKIAQWEHPWLVTLRNGLLPFMPQSVNERQIKTLFEVDF